MSVNKAIILGRIGKIDKRISKNGDPVVSMTVATSERWKDKQGQKQERTEWHNVSLFSYSAKFISQYASVGDMVFIEGKITTEKYTGKDGVDKYTTKIIAESVEITSKNKKEDSKPTEEKEEEDYLNDDFPM